MFDYWSWWVSAIALFALSLAFFIFLRRPMGVSGCWARVVMRKNDRHVNEAEAPFRENPLLLKDSLMAATIDEFGREAVVEFLKQRRGQAIPNAGAAVMKLAARTPWTCHMTFLAALVLGGFIAANITGQFEFRSTLGALHTSLFGTGIGYWITLMIGGAMVGFGTQMAGGCTSGHGLNGCSRFVPASLAATTVFFSTAVAVSMLIHFVAKGALQ